MIFSDKLSSRAWQINWRNLYFQKEVESVLQKNTLDAFDNDIFGVPTFVYEDKIFWGQDRIFFLEKEIKKSDE